MLENNDKVVHAFDCFRMSMSQHFFPTLKSPSAYRLCLLILALVLESRGKIIDKNKDVRMIQT